MIYDYTSANMRDRISFLLITAVLLSGFISQSVAQERGNPLLRNYTPQEYGGHIQVWGITQTRFGHIIFGTGSGLIYYDGTHFGNVENSGSMTTRIINTSDGNLFYASRERFGKVVISESGGYRIEPIYRPADSSNLNLSTEVAALHELNGDIWFSNASGLFRFGNEALTQVPVADTITHNFYKSFIVNGQLLAISTGVGIYETDAQGTLQKIPGTDYITTNDGAYIPEFIIPFDSTRYLYGTAGNGLYFYHPTDENGHRSSHLTPLENETNEQLKQTVIVDALRLMDGRFAIATSGDGIFVLDEQANIVQLIDHRSGLARQSINSIFEDRQGNVWVGMNGGLSLVEIHHPITVYDENNGLVGIPIDILEVDGSVYVASSLGLYRLSEGQFEPLDGLQAPTWGLNLYSDAANERDKLLVGNQFGLWLTDGDRRAVSMQIEIRST
jgi:ligand-binding sensor domain-containing protein